MTKKNKKHPTVDDILQRPWCYYCERDFDDLNVLISHQKAKHFKCDRCGRRLNTAGGLSVHMSQVHKETLTSVENALPNRADLNVEIFGMEGIPDDVVHQHNQRVVSQFHQSEVDRRAATGNPVPGSASAINEKKRKLESPGDLKKKLAEHRAKKAREANGETSGSATPNGAAQAVQSPALPQSPSAFQQFAPQVSPPQPAFLQPYGQPAFPPVSQQPPYGYSPPSYPIPGQQFSPGMPPFAQPPTPGQFPPQPYGASSSPLPFQTRPPPVQSASPFQNGSAFRPPGLPPIPGLPQKPSTGAPPVNALQMQQMHQGQFAPGSNAPVHHNEQPATQDPRVRHANNARPSTSATTVDDLVNGAAKQSQAEVSTPLLIGDEAVADKKGKKGKKEKQATLKLSDNDFSPEEKMARSKRYAFDPTTEPEETALGNIEATTTGPVDNEIEMDNT